MASNEPQLIRNLTEMRHLGRGLASKLDAGDILCLHGPLGAGKSTLARAIITELCRDIDDIPSPTFTLVQPYMAQAGFEVWHLDLYRLESPDEVIALGIEEAFYEACCLIEWPERMAGLLPDTAMHLYLDFGPDKDSRILNIANSDTGGDTGNKSQTKLAGWLATAAASHLPQKPAG